MSAQGGLRTIWITIRAMNYATRVFDDIQKDLKSLMDSEGKLLGINKELIKSTMQYAVAGIMFATLSNRLSNQLLAMAGASKEGAKEIARLNQTMNEAMKSIGGTAFEVIKATGILDTMNRVLSYIRDNKWAQQLIVYSSLLLIGLTALAAIVFLGGAAFHALEISAKVATVVLKFFNLIEKETVITTRQMAGALFSVTAGFAVFFLLQDTLGPIPALLIAMAVAMGILAVQAWLAAGAISVMSFGTAAAIGAAALASAGAVAYAIGATGKAQMGTRGVSRTGPIIAHAGEVIYNPATNRPLQVGNDLAKGKATGTTNNFNVPIVIENLHTKSDVDEVGDEISKALRKGMRGRK